MNSAESASRPPLQSFLDPASIVLFGASEDETKLRGRITRLIVENGYAGDLYFINPARTRVAGRPCYAKLQQVGRAFDLAIIVVPAGQVIPVLEECAACDVRNALILSSGFGEEGGVQTRAQDRITDIARASGMRVCGPNAEGFHNELVSLSATFSPAVEIAPGDTFIASSKRIGVIAQSGGVGFALYHRGRHLGLSYTQVITTGNEADLTAADFLAHMVDDPATEAVVLFLEAIRNGPHFVRALERAAERKKPIIAVKVGRSAAGARATVSHTGAIAGSNTAYDAMFERHGVTVTDDLNRALAIVAAFVTNPLPKGSRAAVVTVSGGAGALVADRLGESGFQLPEPSRGLQQSVRALIPSYGSTANPIDVTGQATRTGAPLRTMELLSESDEVDAVVMASTMSNPTRPPVDVEGLKTLAARRLKPIFFFTYTLPSKLGLRALAEAGFVTYTSLSEMIAAMDAMRRYRRFLDRWVPMPNVLPAPAIQLPRGVLAEHSAKDLLESHGVQLPMRCLIRTEADVANIPSNFFPVAAKVQSVDLPHKTEAGGIRLNLPDAASLRAARAEILARISKERPEARIDGVLVEPMAKNGLEMMIGAIRDPQFGPIISVSAGGVTAELIKDSIGIQGPVDEPQALDLISRLKLFPLLEGYRGSPPADVAALAKLLAKISKIATEHAADFSEIELNPVIVHRRGEGLTIVDALIAVDPRKKEKTSLEQAA